MGGSGRYHEALCGGDALALPVLVVEVAPCVRVGEEEEEQGVSRGRGARQAALLPSPPAAAVMAAQTLRP